MDKIDVTLKVICMILAIICSILYGLQAATLLCILWAFVGGLWGFNLFFTIKNYRRK